MGLAVGLGAVGGNLEDAVGGALHGIDGATARIPRPAPATATALSPDRSATGTATDAAMDHPHPVTATCWR